MDAGLLNVLHDRADHDCLTVTHCIDIYFNGSAEKTVEQNRRVLRDSHGITHVAQ